MMSLEATSKEEAGGSQVDIMMGEVSVRYVGLS
jgi:hypothetical protein